jgi:hypothetical protein
LQLVSSTEFMQVRGSFCIHFGGEFTFTVKQTDSLIFQEPVNNAGIRPTYGLRDSVKRSVIFRDQSGPSVRRDLPTPSRFVRPSASEFRPSRSLIFPDNQVSSGQLTPAAAVLNVHLPAT